MAKSITFINSTGIVLDIFLVNEYIDHIMPNEKLTIPMPDYYPLFYGFRGRFLEKAVHIGTSYAHGSSDPDIVEFEITIPDKSDYTLNQLGVSNETNLTLSLERIDSGNFHRVGVLEPFSEVNFISYIDKPHVLRDMYSGYIVDYFSGIGNHTYSWLHTEPLKSGKPVTLHFMNCSTQEMTLFKMLSGDPYRKEVARIGVGEVYEVQSYMWEMFEYTVPNQTNDWSNRFFAGSAPIQNVFLHDKTKSVRVSFHNQMNLVLKAYMMTGSEKRSFGEIAPYDTFNIYSNKGAEWVFTAKFGSEETGPVHRTTVYEAGTYNINGNHLGQAIPAESKTRTVILNNKSPFEVNIQEKKTDERLGEVLGAIPPGSSKDLTIQVGKTLEARDKYSNHRIAQLVVPHGDGTFNYDIQLKSWNSQHASTLTIYNRTNILLDVFWLDYDGTEQPIAEIAPGGARRLQTYLTHVWVIKDKRSGRIIDRIYAKQQDEVVEINSYGITPKEGQPEVKINFSNKLPFAVDLYKVTAAHQEEFLTTMPPQGYYPMTNQNATPVRIREYQSQAEVELYVPGTAPVQNLDIQLKAPNSARKTTVEVINLSVFSIKVFKFDANGSPQKVTELKSRMSKKLSDVIVGQPFYLEEADSGTVVGYFVSTENPIRYEFSGINLRSVYSAQRNKVTFENLSGFDIDVYWMNNNGEEEYKGHMAPQSKSNNKLVIEDARIGHIYVFREQTTNTFLDEKILYSSRDSQTIQINPRLISQTERTPDQLWPGEVALFTEPNYKGTAYIFHKDVYGVIQEINDKVKSIKLGPGTALTAFSDYKFGGINDVFYLDTPDLSQTDIKSSMSSFQISTITPELTSGISAISRLTEEPVLKTNGGKKEISCRPVFRTTITFPASVSAVDIFSTEETTFEVGNKPYTVDPVKHARIKLGGAKQIVITTPAKQIRESILMLRTDTMHRNERFFVFQDVDLHKKLTKLDAGALVRDRRKLGINSNYTDAQINGVQSAIQNLANAIPAVHADKAHGQTKDLYIASQGMEYDTWGMNFTNGEAANNDQAVFRPLSTEEIKVATRQGESGVKRRNLDTEAGQLGFLKDMAKGAKNFVVQPVKVVKKAAEEVADVTSDIAKKGVAAVANTAKDTAQVVATTGVSAVNLVKSGAGEVGNFAAETFTEATKLPSKAIDLAEDVADEVISVGETALKATLDLGNEIVEFTIDTVDKVADCIELIVEKVVESVEKVIDYLKDLFSWDDIIDTHDILVKYFNGSMDGIRNKVIPNMEKAITSLLDSMEKKVMDAIDEMMDDYGAGMNTPEEKENSGMEQAMDKLGWFIDKIFGGEEDGATSSAGSGIGAPDAEVNAFVQVLNELKVELEKLLVQYGSEIINAFIDGIEMLISAVTAGKEAVKYIIGGLLSIVKALSKAGFAIVRVLTTVLIKCFKAVITLFQQACNAKIDIPFLSDLYKTGTGSDLTLLSITSLLLAAPATIICKIAHGKPPKAMVKAAGQSASQGWAQFISIVYGCSHLALAFFDTLNDFVGAKEEFGLFGSRSQQQTNVRSNLPPGGGGVPPQQGVIQTVKAKVGPMFDKPSHVVTGIVNLLGLFTQCFGVSLIPEKTDPDIKINPDEVDRVFNTSYDNVKDGFASTVWYCQWLYNAIGLVDWGCSAWGSDGVKSVVGKGAKIATTGLGVVHLGVNIAQIVFDVVDTQESKPGSAYDAGEKAKLAFRSIASLISPLPSIGKVLFLFKYPATAIVGSGLNATGHFAEGGIFVARGIYKDV